MHLPESPRLLFSEFTPDDFPEVAPLLMEDEVMQKFHPRIAEELIRRWLARRMDEYRMLGHSHWHVSLKDTGEFVGIIGIVPTKVEDAEYIGLGYHIKKEFRRRGYAFEGSLACIEWAFRELHADKIVAEIDEDNPPSRCLAEKLGMDFEKTYPRFNGEDYVPHCLYSISADKFYIQSRRESY